MQPPGEATMREPGIRCSPDTAMQYAEQLGWLSNRAAELQAALDFQTQRAGALEAAQQEAAAQAAQDEATSHQLHAAAAEATERAWQEADAQWSGEVEALRTQLHEAQQKASEAEERISVSENRCRADALRTECRALSCATLDCLRAVKHCGTLLAPMCKGFWPRLHTCASAAGRCPSRTPACMCRAAELEARVEELAEQAQGSSEEIQLLQKEVDMARQTAEDLRVETAKGEALQEQLDSARKDGRAARDALVAKSEEVLQLQREQVPARTEGAHVHVCAVQAAARWAQATSPDCVVRDALAAVRSIYHTVQAMHWLVCTTISKLHSMHAFLHPRLHVICCAHACKW